MKKGLLFLLVLFLNATEFEYGHGSFNIEFGALGMNKNHSEKIKIFSILQSHKNIFSSKWFYSYRISWFKSNTIKTVVNDYNSAAESINGVLNKTIPVIGNPNLGNGSTDSNNSDGSSNDSIGNTGNTNNGTASDSQTLNPNLPDIPVKDLNSSLKIPQLVNLSNKIRGLDINIVFGRDLINKDIQDTYLGIGFLTGITLPYIKSSSDSNNDYLKKSKTKIITYKLGGIIKGGYLLNSFMQVYGDISYSYQTARVKNDELNINSKSSGNNFLGDLGVKFQLKGKKDLGWITLMPSVFLTMGYRYCYWDVKSIKINNQDLMTKNTKLSFEISEIYLGLGYDF